MSDNRHYHDPAEWKMFVFTLVVSLVCGLLAAIAVSVIAARAGWQ